MSAAAERRTNGNETSSPKSGRRARQRKPSRSALASGDRRFIVLIGALGVVFPLLAGSLIVRALRPSQKPVPAPVVVAKADKSRGIENTPPPPTMPTPPAAPEVEQLPAPREEQIAKREPPAAPPPLPPAPPVPADKPKAGDPALPAAAPKQPVVEAGSGRKRKGPSEFELLRQVADFQDFGLTTVARQSMAASYQAEYQINARLQMRPDAEPSTLINYFPEAKQLPIRNPPHCQLPPHEAITLGNLSRKLHAYLALVAPFDANGKRKEPIRLREVLKRERREKRPEWLRPESVPAMVQILMHEDVPLRLLLVELLAEIEGPAATTRLAQRAVFDFAPEVREAAVAALRDRPRDPARSVLVAAFAYPWPRAAVHAAEALVALDDKDAAPLLVAQLGKPDPTLPYTTSDGRIMVRDVVRLNHVGSCLICHAPAFSGRDPVVGIDPITLRPTSTVENPNTHYGKPFLTDGRSGIWGNNILIRADVQFLRQDFSVTFPVKQVFGVSQGQRYDFVVRTRQLKGDELKEYKKQEPSPSASYPQRESALTALRALAGKDAGPTTDAWVKLYPSAGAEAEGLRISEALLKATHQQYDRLVAKYRDANDDNYTEALACAIPRLGGKLQEKVREALVVRLTRTSAEEIRARLGDDDEELRHAAAVACARMLDRELIPELIALLLDDDARIVVAARKALQFLTDADFGPEANASPADRATAVARWQAWRRSETQP
jgi:HEAT repeat protein